MIEYSNAQTGLRGFISPEHVIQAFWSNGRRYIVLAHDKSAMEIDQAPDVIAALRRVALRGTGGQPQDYAVRWDGRAGNIRFVGPQ
ncbi:hypothetical protein CcrBL47_gp112 [Caulobacter phage BL47]|nr:hypothetical protein CcrBL47_gp112 [Caulobacter phage BL47]